MLKKILSYSAYILMSVLLAGCKVGPNYHLPVNAAFNNPAAQTLVSANEHLFSNEEAPNRWWELYHDPVLNSLIEEALCANTDLRVAEANVIKANAELHEAKAVLYPTTNLFTSFVNYHVSSETFIFSKPIPKLPFVNYLLAGGGVTLPIDFFGKLHRGIEAARANVEAKEAARDFKEITVIAETASAYTDMCAAEYQLSIARHLLRLQEEMTSLTKQLQLGGRSGEIEVTRSNAELEQIRATLPVLVASSHNAVFRLAYLTGHAPAEFVHTLTICKSLPKLDNMIPVGDASMLLHRRPDIREAERNLAASTARIGIATADLFPKVSLFSLDSTFGHYQDAFTLKTFIGLSGPLITWTFPNVSIAKTHIAQARADTQADFAKFDGTVLAALKDIETNLTTYAYDLARYQDLQAAQVQSEKAFLQTRSLYRNGRQGFLNTLEAEKTFTAVTATLAIAESKLVTDQINLFLSLGGGWCQNDCPHAEIPIHK